VSASRVLVAGVGQPWMRDLAFGCHVVRRLQSAGAPRGIDVLDLSFGAVAAVQSLRDQTYRRAVFVTARAAGRLPGRLFERRGKPLPCRPDEVQARIADALMGSVSLDTLLVVWSHFGALPPEVTVIEVEPTDETWGPDLSPQVDRLVERAAGRAVRAACRSRRGRPTA
jgi:hydrogenase maturation protease